MNEHLNFGKFQREILKMGLNYSQDDLTYFFSVLKDCGRRVGIPAAGGTAVLAASAGSVVVPGVGAVPGWLLGAMAGFATGTAACTVTRMAMKQELDKLLIQK